MEFTGKTVFITGAGSGIGKAQTIAFLEEGANVFALDLETQGLEILAEKYKHFSYSVGSVTDRSIIEAAVQQTVSEFGSIDILVNTAGILDGYAKTLETDEALWDKVMNTNVKGMYLVTNAVLPYMLKQERNYY